MRAWFCVDSKANDAATYEKNPVLATGFFVALVMLARLVAPARTHRTGLAQGGFFLLRAPRGEHQIADASFFALFIAMFCDRSCSLSWAS
jgi:hypothetical protein